MTDLDRLETLRDNATQGEWHQGRDNVRYEEPVDIYNEREPSGTSADICRFDKAEDAEYITALHNADLIGRVRELEAREAKVREHRYYQTGQTEYDCICGEPCGTRDRWNAHFVDMVGDILDGGGA